MRVARKEVWALANFAGSFLRRVKPAFKLATTMAGRYADVGCCSRSRFNAPEFQVQTRCRALHVSQRRQAGAGDAEGA